MAKALAIDPGIFKCGCVLVDIKQKEVCFAEVIKSEYLLNYVKKIYQRENSIQCIIGNGTSSKRYINDLNEFVQDLIIAEEMNTTFRAKERYFEIFPLRGLKYFLPKDIFILNKNLDALAALIIMEDYYSCKFTMSELINTKTWLK